MTALTAVLSWASPAAAAASLTTVAAVPSSAQVGEPVQLTATVSCASDPSGGLGVTFFDGGELLETVDVSAGGQAAFTASFASAGSHTVTAVYNGNAECDASHAVTSVEVTAVPAAPGGLCLLSCGGLISININDSFNNG
ncbi:Ig-like domain-containing protein [Streptomyces sp. NPDC101219]|uniref:Ig-like domain-containing protein n=1 Tax=Streptomyces sp. NPDC101219 TaxID=3366131 RepID=UPI0037F70A14